MSSWRQIFAWEVRDYSPEGMLSDIVNGPPLTWREASSLLTSRGFWVAFNYHNPGHQAVEIGLQPEVEREITGKSAQEVWGEGLREFLQGGDIPVREGMEPYQPLLLQFLQNRVSPGAEFKFFRGRLRWVARFKIPFRDRYLGDPRKR